jgi:hemerythrin
MMWAGLVRDDVPHDEFESALEDEHHKILSLVDELREEITNDAAVSEQRCALHLLASFLRMNCLDEEEVMKDCGFPLIRMHKEDHRTQYASLHTIEGSLIAGKKEQALAELKAFHQSLIRHVREQDQDIVDWQRRYRGRAKSEDPELPRGVFEPD